MELRCLRQHEYAAHDSLQIGQRVLQLRQRKCRLLPIAGYERARADQFQNSYANPIWLERSSPLHMSYQSSVQPLDTYFACCISIICFSTWAIILADDWLRA
jgi:hypothetical protein